MKRDDIDWTILKGSVISFMVCLLISGLFAGGSYYFRDRAQIEFQQNKNKFQSISRRYLAVDEEERLIRQFYPEFVDLYNTGIIGREHRLNWIEVLRQVGERIMLPSLSYQISSQEVYTPGYSINLGGFQLFRSSMQLNLGLLHEGDLQQLLKNLDEQAEGTYSVSECTFNNRSQEIKNKDTANISAECLLQWFTIKLANGVKLELS